MEAAKLAELRARNDALERERRQAAQARDRLEAAQRAAREQAHQAALAQLRLEGQAQARELAARGQLQERRQRGQRQERRQQAQRQRPQIQAPPDDGANAAAWAEQLDILVDIARLYDSEQFIELNRLVAAGEYPNAGAPRVTPHAGGGATWWFTTSSEAEYTTHAEAAQVAAACADGGYTLSYRRIRKPREEEPIVFGVVGVQTPYVDEAWCRCSIQIDHASVVNRHGLTAGSIMGIVLQAAERAYGYTYGYMLALTKHIPGGDAWLAMRDGEFNCAVEVIIADQKTTGNWDKPTKKAQETRRVLEHYSVALQRLGGCTEEHLPALTRAAGIRLEVRAADDTVLWSPTKNGKPIYTKQRLVVIYRADGHAYGTKHTVPEITRAAYWRRETASFDPEQIRLDQLAAVETILEGNTQRAYLLASAIVTDDGTIYREREHADELAVAMGINPRDEAAMASLIHRGTARSYKFNQWLIQHGIEQVGQAWSATWRAATVEARVWNASRAYDDTYELDMAAAFLACGSQAGAGSVPQRYAAVHAWPAGKMCLFAISTVGQAAGRQGAVRVTSWQMSPGAHPAIVKVVATHLAASPWLPVPLALYLHDAGLATLEVDRLMASAGCLKAIEFPADRNLGVEFVGSCARKVRRRSIVTRDRTEAGFYLEHFEHKGFKPLLREGRSGNIYEVDYERPELAGMDHAHIRAYVLAYTHIGVFTALQQFADPTDVVYVCTDGMRVKQQARIPAGVAVAEPNHVGGVIQWRWSANGREHHWIDRRPQAGIWRAKSADPAYAFKAQHAALPAQEGEHGPAQEQAPALSDDVLAASQLAFVAGQGGAGKSYRITRAFEGRDAIVLTHDNDSAIKFRDDQAKNPFSFPCQTYHSYFHLGDKKHDEWDPACMGVTSRASQVIIWDEIGLVDITLLRRVLPWLKEKVSQVVFSGDCLGQLPPFKQTKNEAVQSARELDAFLRAECITETMTTDRRAKSEPLRSLKLRMWCQPDAVQAAELDKMTDVPSMTMDDALASWQEGDLFVAPTRAQRDAASQALLASGRLEQVGAKHLLRFSPQTPELRARYQKSKNVYKQVKVPGEERTVPAYVSNTVEVSRWAQYDPQLWRPAYAATVHGVQGYTVKAPGRVFMLRSVYQAASWAANILYTVVSRLEHLDQLVIVDGDASPPPTLADITEEDALNMLMM